MKNDNVSIESKFLVDRWLPGCRNWEEMRALECMVQMLGFGDSVESWGRHPWGPPVYRKFHVGVGYWDCPMLGMWDWW